MTIEIKQIGKFDDRDNKSDYGEYTMLPMSSRHYVIQKGLDGKFRTGLENDDKKRKELEQILNADLSPTSDYWKTVFKGFTFRMPTGSMMLNLKDPLQELFYLAAVANFRLAPDKDTLKEEYKYKQNTIFYVNDKEREEKKLSQLQELKDEVTKYVYDARNNKDRMLFISYALGLFVTESFRAENLYNLLTKYKDGLKTKLQFETIRDVFKQSNEELQAAYYLKQALKYNVVAFDTNINKYKFQEKHIGKNEAEALIYLKDKKNEVELAALIMEVKDKQS